MQPGRQHGAHRQGPGQAYNASHHLNNHNNHYAHHQQYQQSQPNHAIYPHAPYMNPYANNPYYHNQMPQPPYQQYPQPPNPIYHQPYQQLPYGRDYSSHPSSHFQPQYANPPPVVSSSNLPHRPQHMQPPPIVSSYAPIPAHSSPRVYTSNAVNSPPSELLPVTSPIPPQSESIPDTPHDRLAPASTVGTESSLPTAAISIPSLSPSSPPAFTVPNDLIPRNTQDMALQSQIPWYSHSVSSGPTRPVRRRKRRIHNDADGHLQPVELPANGFARPQIDELETSAEVLPTTTDKAQVQSLKVDTISTSHELEQDAKSVTSIAQPGSESLISTAPTTPIQIQPTAETSQETTKINKSAKAGQQKITPVPILPALPKQTKRPQSNGVTAPNENIVSLVNVAATIETEQVEANVNGDTTVPTESTIESQPESTTTTTGPPSSWAQLFKARQSAVSATSDAANSNANIPSNNSFARANQESLAGALQNFNATVRDGNLNFLKPRGLVNTGNMCYMNAVLQVLVFCVPFYDFLDQAGKRAAHSFKSDTPLIDSMIMFMREFPTITSADTASKLKLQIRNDDVEKYGDAFIPANVYDTINKLPRFSAMKRGHQQDAEEFLGFLLEGLHDECAHVIKASGSTTPASLATPVPGSPASEMSNLTSDAGWHEVGPKQRAATTQSSGISVDTPITKIFGGMLRSELKVQGAKLSVTMEPYQPLQLDIDSPTTNNVIDALKAMTKPETIVGDFGSSRPGSNAVKQLLIETLPPVLIIHLKRFKYNNVGGTQKIWKKVGYPLDLELPKEVFSRQKQTSMTHSGGLPKYKLLAVVYHHGKNATGGHYTVDVRRQDGKEWIRMDDTIIRRVNTEDIAEGGSEEDPKVLAKVLAEHKKDSTQSGNIYDQIKDDEAEDSGADEWKQVNGVGSQKKWSAVANGTATPKKPKDRDLNLKDNKVAYLLFYQRV